MSILFLLLQAPAYDLSSIVGISIGTLGGAFGAFSVWRSNRLSNKVTETQAILSSWKEFSQNLMAQIEAQEHRLSSQETRMESQSEQIRIAVAQTQECERKHSYLEGKFEGLGLVQRIQTEAAQGHQAIQALQQRQDAQEERQDAAERKGINQC